MNPYTATKAEIRVETLSSLRALADDYEMMAERQRVLSREARVEVDVDKAAKHDRSVRYFEGRVDSVIFVAAAYYMAIKTLEARGK